MIHAVIFAAGLGTRLKPLTDTMPKALVPLAGKPLLQWQVEKLRDAGITDITVNVHHFPDQIIDTIRVHKGWGCNIRISDERDMLLDTGGGLKKMYNAPFTMHDEPVLACNVDVLSNIDIKALIAQYEKTGISQLVVSERQTQRYLIFGEKDFLCGWTNIATGEKKGKDGMHLAFSGMQILSPDVLARLAQREEDKFSLIPFYLDIMQEIPLQAYVPSDYRMMDVGKIDQISEAEAFAESLQ
ncbi:MAG: nucleotidyltransferase family protein [Paludibacteraceae bacterium]|nr:nucleotidyltransferase family protein [Paludibacteraceae bacterium]